MLTLDTKAQTCEGWTKDLLAIGVCDGNLSKERRAAKEEQSEDSHVSQERLC